MSFKAAHTMKIIVSSEGKPICIHYWKGRRGAKAQDNIWTFFPQVLIAFQSLKKQCIVIVC